MDFIVDHAVAISAIIWGAAVLIGVIVAIVAGVRLWRHTRIARRRILGPAEALMASADATQARVDELNEHRDDLGRAGEELSVQVRVLGELGRMGVEIVQFIRSPIRLLGR